MKHMLVMVLVLLSAMGSSYADDLLVGIGLSKPPYVIQSENRGLEYEIVERALAKIGHEFIPRYLPLNRIPHELKHGNIAVGMNAREHMDIQGFLSDHIISYQNYAVTLKTYPSSIHSLRDLSHKRVLAFQNARLLLGNEYAAAIRNNRQYRETPTQEIQVKMLAAGRVDVVISDFRIFLHFKKQYERQRAARLPVTFHRIFDPTPYRVAFRSKKIRDQFNLALQEMRDSGEYEAIVSKYITRDDMALMSSASDERHYRE